MTSSKQLPPTTRKPQGLGGWENEDLTQLAAWPQLVKYQLLPRGGPNIDHPLLTTNVTHKC